MKFTGPDGKRGLPEDPNLETKFFRAPHSTACGETVRLWLGRSKAEGKITEDKK